MRFIPALFIVLSIGLALGLVAGSGIGDHLGHEHSSDLHDHLEGDAEEIERVEFDPDEGGEGSFLGSTVAALRGVSSTFQSIFRFPSTLEMLGAPAYAAATIGVGLAILFGLGIYQIVRGTELQ